MSSMNSSTQWLVSSFLFRINQPPHRRSRKGKRRAQGQNQRLATRNRFLQGMLFLIFRKRKRIKPPFSKNNSNLSKGNATTSKPSSKTSKKKSSNSKISTKPSSLKIELPTVCSVNISSESKKPWRSSPCSKLNSRKAKSPTKNKSPDSKASSNKLKRNSTCYTWSTKNTTMNPNIGEADFPRHPILPKRTW